jgi:hypothetical protein
MVFVLAWTTGDASNLSCQSLYHVAFVYSSMSSSIVRASPLVLSMSLWIVKMSKFSFFFLGNPTNKTVTVTAYTWGLLIANHLNQSLWSTNQNYWATIRSNLLHSFLEAHNCVVPFTSHGKLHEFGAEKPISWGKPAHFDFFTINFTVSSHILSTGGDALTQSKFNSTCL